MVGSEDAFPFGFAEIAIVLDLVAALVNEFFASNIRRTRDRTLAFAARDNAGFEAIESRTLPSL